MRIQCPTCNKPFEVPESYVGRNVKCSGCKSTFVVPQAQQLTASIVPASSGTAPSQPRTPNTGVHSNSANAARQSAPNALPLTQNRRDPSVPSNNNQQKSASGSTDWQRADLATRQRTVMAGFHGAFVKPKTSFAYRLGLFLSAGVMLILPILYLLFIVGIGAAVWWHLAHNGRIFASVRGRAAIIALMLYLAPAIVGIIAIVFMFKPIFARPIKKGRTRSLTDQGEPILFEFVRKICNDVGAPMPKRIDIDNEVNASASFRSGWWSILRGNDLVLTLGMPLVSGLSLQQLAGVLAHEFGHFSQGAGMRVSYVLRSINFWFVRAVYERDSMDAWLESTSQELDFRISWVFYLARFAVYISRGFLFLLLLLGNLLTGLIQQQMEFDADRYEVGMAGKLAFATTFQRLRILSVAYNHAMGTLNRIFNEGRLVSNFPSLTQYQAKKLPKDVIKKIEEEASKTKTGLFDSHPSDSARISAVQALPDEGVFRSDWPAQALFVHFDAACDGVTTDMYKAFFGTEVSRKKLVPTASIMAEESVEDEAWEALQRFFCDGISAKRAFPLPNYEVFSPPDYEHALQTLKNARQWMLHSVEHYKGLTDQQEYAQRKKRNQEMAAQFKRRHSKMKEELLKIDPDDIPKSTIQIDPAIAGKFVQASTIRLHTACCLLQHPNMASSIPKWSQLQNRVNQILAVLGQLEADLPNVLVFGDMFAYQVFCLNHFESNNNSQDMLVRDLLGNSSNLVEKVSHLRSGWLHLRYPFEHADPNMTIGKHVTTDILIAEEVGTVVDASESLLDRYYNLRGRCLGHLAIAAEAVEKALGLEPLTNSKEKSIA